MAHVCVHCQSTLSSIGKYIRHMHLHRNLPNAKFPCPMTNCQCSLPSPVALKAHIHRGHSKVQRFSQVDTCHTYQCQQILCGKKFCSGELLMRHLRQHITTGREDTKCPYSDCSKSFTNLSSFTSHISRQHRNDKVPYLTGEDENKSPNGEQNVNGPHFILNDPVHCETFTPQSHADVGAVYSGAEQQPGENSHTPPASECSDLVDDIGEMADLMLRNAALFFLKLQVKHLLPSSTIQKILEELKGMHESDRDFLHTKIRHTLQQLEVPTETINELITELEAEDVLSQAFTEQLRTAKMRQRYYHDNLAYVAANDVVVGHDDIDKEICIQYVSIIDSIKSVYLNNTEHFCFQGMGDGESVVMPDVFEDIDDGKVFKGNKLFQECSECFGIVLYMDAFELANPLGAAKCKHKMIGVYYTLANFRPELRSGIDQIQLVLLFEEKHIKKLGFDALLAPLLKDLRQLESVGVEVLLEKRVKGTVICVTGDNLGAHQLGGFSENFSTETFFCRYCCISRDEFTAEPWKLGTTRSIAHYQSCVDVLDQDETQSKHLGVKRNSAMNSLAFFHVCNPGLPPCLAHDLFEGVVAYDLALIIKHFVKTAKLFTYDQLNKGIRKTTLKGRDGLDKPAPVKEGAKKLSGNAVANWVFVRMFPLYVCPLVDVEDPVWELYLLLKTIIELVCSPKLSVIQISVMQDVIGEYLEARKTLFPDTPLRPKHHYLAHYPKLTVEFGPLVRTWTLRFESKHTFFKRVMRRLQNFKNPSKMLAEQHQLLQAYYTASQGSLFQSQLSCESSLPYCDGVLSGTIESAVQEAEIVTSCISMTYKVTVKGTRYDRGMFLMVGKDNDDKLQAGEIELVLIAAPDTVIFVVSVYQCQPIPGTGLQQLFNSDQKRCVSHNKLLDYCPLHAYSYAERTSPPANVLSLKHYLM